MDNFTSKNNLNSTPEDIELETIELDDDELEDDGLDILLQLFACLPKPKAVIINPPKYEKMMKAAEAFDALLKEYETEATVSVSFDPSFLMGAVTAEIADCTELNPQLFAAAVSLANNFDIYSLTNGNFQLELTFQRVFNGIY